MKTDEELLELAARAADIECGEVGPFIEFQEWQSEFGMHIGGSFELVRRNWDPLTNDGDALRLAVKLDMQVTVDCRGKETWINVIGLEYMEAEDFNDDPYAATRRAIVRAAAAVGEKL